ncbi:ROK family protein [Photobacterium minamisatsumaniensis]|uniref:ROK family protein n=1 Tax=Photobacterium minamisatsumaniensis TaxID=2910233 RepID=UPI003D0C0A1C
MREPKYGIGIDIGGTKIAAGLVDLTTGAIQSTKIIPTGRERHSSEIIKDLQEMVTEQTTIALTKGWQIEHCGIAFPELVNNEGEVVSDWNFNLCSLRTDVFPLKHVVFDSDVRAAGLAEAKFGAGKTYQSFVYVSLGTGLSYSLYNQGTPWRGANGYAIHFASSLLSGHCHHCGEQASFIAEEQVSGNGIESTWLKVHSKPYQGGVPALLRAAETRDGDERECVALAAESLGGLIAQMVNMLDPDAVVIGGGLGLAGGIYHELTVKAIRERIWAEECKSIPIKHAQFGTSAGVIGAALSSMENS